MVWRYNIVLLGQFMSCEFALRVCRSAFILELVAITPVMNSNHGYAFMKDGDNFVWSNEFEIGEINVNCNEIHTITVCW